jgi:histone-lysine N-methyltransferase SETMAR
LLAKYKKNNFLWKIITGDEKWIYYNNPFNKQQWLDPGESDIPTPRPSIYRKKVMLCVWWDMKGIVYYELLEPKQTLNANLYSEQLMRLNEKNFGKKNWTRSREEKNHIAS